MDFNQIATEFYGAGIRYNAAIQPYALKLFFALLLIDVVVTWIQYTAEGQLDPAYFLARTIKHMLSAGFIYLMIVNAFSWMNAVVSSFSRIGAAITGLPSLSPETVLQLGGQMASTIFDTPASTSVVTNLEVAIIQAVCGFVVLLAFTLTAIAVLFTLVESYIAIGGGVLLLGFGGSRFTASVAEGYFPFAIRVGMRLLFYYLVLAIGVQIANEWASAILAACKPVATALPWFSTYGVPPSKIITAVCSGFIPTSAMLNYTALALVFAALTIGIPHTVSTLVGGSIGLALSHAVEAAVISRTVVRPITSALQNGFNKVSLIGSGKTEGSSWVNAMDFGHRAQQISNLGPDQGPRVPAPKDVGPTNLLSGAPTRGVGAVPTTGMGKPTRKV